MKFLYWNVRGISKSASQNVLKLMCHKSKPDLVCLAKPVVEFDADSDIFWRSIGLSKVAFNVQSNHMPNICLLCATSILEANDQPITIYLSFDN